MKSAARSSTATRKLVAHVNSARGFFAVVGVGACSGLQSMTPPLEQRRPTKENRLFRQKKSHDRGKNKGNSKPYSRRPSPAKSRQTSRGGVAHGPRVPVKSGQSMLCRQMGHCARDCPNGGSRDENHTNLKRAFGSFVGVVHDQSTTLITKP